MATGKRQRRTTSRADRRPRVLADQAGPLVGERLTRGTTRTVRDDDPS